MGGIVVAYKVTRPKPPPPAQGHFYRVKVGLTYKGQPIDIDFVAGCGVSYHFNRGAGGSTDETVSMTAMIFGYRMPEGHAIAIATIRGNDTSPCRGGTTANGAIPRNWLPRIVWYERDDEFAHGIAYSTQDAYENPGARFGFRGATIEAANRQDYDAYVVRGPQNLLPPYLTDWIIAGGIRPHVTDKDAPFAQFVAHPTSAWTHVHPARCRGLRRIKLEPEQREKARAAWPADHPHLWTFPSEERKDEFRTKVLTGDQMFGTGDYYDADASQEDRDERPKIYPTQIDDALNQVVPGPVRDDWRSPRSFISPDLLGFKYCDALAPPELILAVMHRDTNPMEPRSSCLINDYRLVVKDCGDYPRWVLMEEDEYAIIAEESE